MDKEDWRGEGGGILTCTQVTNFFAKLRGKPSQLPSSVSAIKEVSATAPAIVTD